MAFIQATPVPVSSTTLQSSSQQLSITTRRPPRASTVKPEPPATFTKPDPRTFYIRPDKLGEVASLSFGTLLRFGSGALIEGYRVRRPESSASSTQRLEEYSATLPSTRPDKPLHVFEFEACPFCRKVREAVTLLDLDVIFFPCPKGGVVYRPYVVSNGGKAQFPYLEDPNTGFASYESDDIIRYLYKTYGPASARVPFALSSATMVSAGLASAVRPGKGRQRVKAAVPSKKLVEIWGYEPSPFCKVVRETLNDLEIAHLYHTTPRGSPTRKLLKDMTGRFQVPYLIDLNTGINMWESAEIAEYLRATYGPGAPGALEIPTPEQVYMPGDPTGDTDIEPPSLDPQPVKDESLEKYCEDNPDADECRVYED